MDHHHGNYVAIRALHEARVQNARASAVAAGLAGRRPRDRRQPGAMRKLLAAALVALGALIVASGTGTASPAPMATKQSGVVVIGGNVAASAATPGGAVAYVADTLGG